MPDGGRDGFGRLRCGFPMCQSVVNGVTGLDEIHHLIRHVWRKHGRVINMNLALLLRAKWEEPDVSGVDDHLVERGLVRKVTPVIE